MGELDTLAEKECRERHVPGPVFSRGLVRQEYSTAEPHRRWTVFQGLCFHMFSG